MADLGRQVKYGIGKETVAGTPVTATKWIPQLSFDLNPSVEYATNNSAFGVVERTNASDILHQWAEGTLEAKLTADTGGLILLGAFGSVSTGANADGSGAVKDHTFNVNQNIAGQSFTLVRKDSIATLQYALSRFSDWELDMALNDYLRYKAKVMALAGTSVSATPAYTSEAEFVPKHISVKTASNLAGLSGATAISTVESFTVHVNANLEADFASGSTAPYSFTSRGYEMSFEMECRYTDTTYEAAYKAGTYLALQVTAKNTDVTIGTSANPGLVLTAPRMVITDWARNEDLDKPTTQKMTGTIHYDTTNAYALRAVLTNTTTSY